MNEIDINKDLETKKQKASDYLRIKLHKLLFNFLSDYSTKESGLYPYAPEILKEVLSSELKIVQEQFK